MGDVFDNDSLPYLPSLFLWLGVTFSLFALDKIYRVKLQIVGPCNDVLFDQVTCIIVAVEISALAQ